MNKVIPKNLWIEQVIHALTVTKAWVVHALTVTKSRINGHHTIYSLYLPIVKTPVVGASLFGDNLAGCHPNRLHLPPTAVLKNPIKTKLPLILLVIGLAGCQPKSEIDKCVEAIVKANTDSKTTAQDTAINEAFARLDCLKAQSGK